MSHLQSHPQPQSELIAALLATERRTLRNIIATILEGTLAQVTPTTGQTLLADTLLDVATQQPDPAAFRAHLIQRLQ